MYSTETKRETLKRLPLMNDLRFVVKIKFNGTLHTNVILNNCLQMIFVYEELIYGRDDTVKTMKYRNTNVGMKALSH